MLGGPASSTSAPYINHYTQDLTPYTLQTLNSEPEPWYLTGFRVPVWGFELSVQASGPYSSKILVFSCRTTSASTAPCTPRRMCCLTHCASYCALLASIFRLDSISTSYVQLTRLKTQSHSMVCTPQISHPILENLDPEPTTYNLQSATLTPNP